MHLLIKTSQTGVLVRDLGGETLPLVPLYLGPVLTIPSM